METRDPPKAAPLPIEWEPLRRAVKKVGRNDPCPCGSGKKYKKCCEAKDAARLSDPSPFAGLTRAEAVEDPARHGDPRVFDMMSKEELAGVASAKLTSEQLGTYAVRAAQKGLYDEASRAIDELARRDDKWGADANGFRMDIVHVMVREGDVERADAELAKMTDDHAYTRSAKLAVAAKKRDGAALDLLEAALAKDPDEPLPFFDAAFALHDAGLPATALALIRATPIDVLHPEDVKELQYEADQIRRAMSLPVEDPVFDVMLLAYDRRHPHAEIADTKRVLEEAEKTRHQLDSLKLALGDLQRKRAEAEAALEAAQRQSTASATRVPEADESDALRRKLDALKAEVREQQRERAELRDKLRQLEAPPKRRGAEEEREEPPREPREAVDEGEEVPADRPLRPVTFGPLFYDSVRGLDPKIVLKAQEIALRFGSYDASTWHQAKKMRDLPDVFTLRVGIHHRLILRRSSDGGVEARELVTREAFDGVLRGYRR